MTEADVIRMAREAGFGNVLGGIDGLHELTRFAALVAASTKERCAQICDAEASIEGIAQRCAANIRALKDEA